MATTTRTYYEILGVTQTANLEEIKRAYKAKSLQLHPDKNTDDPEATGKFQELLEAYTVLREPEQREKYDKNPEAFRNGTFMDDDNYEDDEDGDEIYFCPEHGAFHRRSKFNFTDFFEFMFKKHYQRRGGFSFNFDDDDDEDDDEDSFYNFYRRERKSDFKSYKRKGIADWSSVKTNFPSKEELYRTQNIPDQLSKPTVVLGEKPNSLLVEWVKKAPRKEVSHYILQMKIKDSEYKEIYNGKGHDFLVENLVPGETYYFRASAVNSVGASAWSDEKSKQFPGGAPKEAPPIVEEIKINYKNKKKKKSNDTKSTPSNEPAAPTQVLTDKQVLTKLREEREFKKKAAVRIIEKMHKKWGNK